MAVRSALMFGVKCDRCGADAGVKLYATTVEAATNKAKRAGWQVTMSRHTCPTCHEMNRLGNLERSAPS